MNVLQKIISEKDLAWDKHSGNTIENLAVSYELKQGDMIFLNNGRVLHGRTAFEDFEDIDKKRQMIRTWIKDI
tara:strand:+ start:136 stop:354 length:219 start_codon:yes stop_codon:yes gene_type:complete